MKLPRQALTEEEVEQGRQRILQAAARIINKDGIGGLSMRALAAGLGLTTGALYRYFPSKQDILLAYWDQALRALVHRIATIEQSEAGTLPVIRAMLVAYATFCLEDSDRFRLLFLHNGDDGAVTEVLGQTNGLAAHSLLLKRVEEAIETGAFAARDAASVCNILWAGVHGAVVLLVTVTEVDFGAPQPFAEQTIDALMRGFTIPEN